MRILLCLLALAVAAFAGNAVSAPASTPVNALPSPPTLGEMYWDDGHMASGWAWYTGGNYWAVDFEIHDSWDWGWINDVGAVVYPGWPDHTYQGCDIYVFHDNAGSPGQLAGSFHMSFTQGGEYTWSDCYIYMEPLGVFYLAWRQVGNYPNCDAIGVDSSAGSHNWINNEIPQWHEEHGEHAVRGWYGSEWENTGAYSGDFMLRCNVALPGRSDAEDTTWGQVKSLY